MTIRLITGSYASKEEQGIKLWNFNEETGKLTELTGIGGIDRPSFIAVHPTGQFFVAVSETGPGELVSYRIDGQTIHEQSRQPANGDHPAHVTIDQSGRWVLSVNYSGGNINVYPLDESGSLGERTHSVRHEGSGPNKERQDAPHPHSVYQIPGSDRFIVSDLGTDELSVYQLDPASGTLSLNQKIEAAPGSGPRHLACHPSEPFIYSLSELDSAITVYERQEDTFTHRQRLSLLPQGYSGDNTAAEVAVSADGSYLYASNRGHDSIAVFSIDGGELTMIETVPAGGQNPRHFTLLPRSPWLVTANESSGNLAVLEINSAGIPLAIRTSVSTLSPVCVKPIDVRS